MSKPTSARFRRPTADEQHVLQHLTLRLVQPREVARYDALMRAEHYLQSARVVGEHLRYVATYRGPWLALATWCAPALHLKAREAFIGWSEEQRRRRLALVVNNSRLCVLPACHYPNLISRLMKLMLGRLCADWQAAWGHPVALAETFVDAQQFQGTAYKVSGWSRLGQTAGWKRSADDFYEPHDRPKQVWVRELEPRACARLRAPALPAAWAAVEAAVPPRCTARVPEMRSLVEHLWAEVPEFRRAQALGYPVGRAAGADRAGDVQRRAPRAARPGRLRGHALAGAVAGVALSVSSGHAARALSAAHDLRAGAGGGGRGGSGTGAVVLAGAGAGASAGPRGHRRWQGTAPRESRTGQRRQRPGPLAGHRGRAGRQPRNPGRAHAAGQAGRDGQTGAGRCLAHADGDGATDSLRGRRR